MCVLCTLSSFPPSLPSLCAPVGRKFLLICPCVCRGNERRLFGTRPINHEQNSIKGNRVKARCNDLDKS